MRQLAVRNIQHDWRERKWCNATWKQWTVGKVHTRQIQENVGKCSRREKLNIWERQAMTRGGKTERNRRQEWKKKKENSKGAGSASPLSQPVSDLPEHWSLWLCLSPSLQHSITWHPGPFYSPAVTHKQTLDEESRKAKKRGECLHFTLEVSRDQLKQQQTLCKMH